MSRFENLPFVGGNEESYGKLNSEIKSLNMIVLYRILNSRFFIDRSVTTKIENIFMKKRGMRMFETKRVFMKISNQSL